MAKFVNARRRKPVEKPEPTQPKRKQEQDRDAAPARYDRKG